MAPRKAPAKRAPKEPKVELDFSSITPGTRLQAGFDGVYYTAEVVQVSTAAKRARAPIKVHYLGYTDDSDEWVSVDRIRSKAITEVKKPPKKTSSVDTAVTLYPYFKVNEGKMDEFKEVTKAFAEAMKPEEEKCLYYGFSIDAENSMAHCREAYADADGLLAHLKNVDATLKVALGLASIDRLYVSGPAAELDKVREALAPLGCKFYTTDVGARTYAFNTPTKWDTSKPDTTCALYPYWGIKNMGAFQASLEYFSRCMNPKKENACWWGFVTDKDNNKALCRESYKNGQGILTHLKNCKKPLDTALGLADIDLLEVHAPAAELEKVKEPLSAFGCKFFELQEGAKTWSA